MPPDIVRSRYALVIPRWRMLMFPSRILGFRRRTEQSVTHSGGTRRANRSGDILFIPPQSRADIYTQTRNQLLSKECKSRQRPPVPDCAAAKRLGVEMHPPRVVGAGIAEEHSLRGVTRRNCRKCFIYSAFVNTLSQATEDRPAC